MKIQFLALAFALAALPVAAQLPKASEVPPGEMAPADVDFMRTADAANIDQITLAARASSRAKIPGVRSLAENVERSHKKADDALRLLAGVKHVDLDHRMTERGQADADQLVRKDVPAERLYVEGVARDGTDLIALYENASANSPDPDVRKFADTMLPALRDNTRQAKDLMARRGWPADQRD
jgi:putative membrane protein